MMKKWSALGLLGMACGLGFAAEPGSVDPQGIRGAAEEEREACLRRSMEGAVDIYALRALGRAEARAIELPPDRGAERAYPEGGRAGVSPSWEGAVDIYALRRPGREEAHEVWVPGYDADEAAAARETGEELRVYELREPGREEAHRITGVCPAAEEDAA
jgi:hypothetical protein